MFWLLLNTEGWLGNWLILSILIFSWVMWKGLPCDKSYKCLSHPSIYDNNKNVVQIKIPIIKILFHGFAGIYVCALKKRFLFPYRYIVIARTSQAVQWTGTMLSKLATFPHNTLSRSRIFQTRQHSLFFLNIPNELKNEKYFFTEVCLCIFQSIKHKMEYLPKIKCQHFSLGPVFPVQPQLHQVILQVILFRFRYLVWMSGTKHVALWSLMFQFCHLLDLQNGIHATRSSGQGVWVPVISYLKQICSFFGRICRLFQFLPSHLCPPLPLAATPSPCR